MPYKISAEAEGCAGYAVVKPDGEVVGCHTSRAAALRHQRALYANVPDAVGKSTTEELEQLHTNLHERYPEPETDEAALLAHHLITTELLERGEAVAELREWANTSFVHPIEEYVDGADLEELGLAEDEIVAKWIDAWEVNEIDVFSLRYGMTVKGDRLLVKVADSDTAKLVVSTDVEKAAESDTFIPPEGVAREAKMALEWIKEGHAGSGFTDVGRARAAQLAARRPVSLRTIKRMVSFFSRHQPDRKAEGFARGEKGFPSGGRVAHNAWGGFTGEAWAKRIIEGVSKGLDDLGKGEDFDLLASDVISKAEEKRFTLGPLYIPDSLDAHNEWTDSEELQRAVWDYVKSGDRRIRLQHNRDVVAGEWVEVMTFPHKLTVPMTKASGEEASVTYPPNTVFMGVQWEDWAWDLVKQGKLRGYSIGGKAKRIDANLETTEEEEVEESDPSVNSVHVDTIMKPPKKKKVTKHGSHDQSTHNPHKGGRGAGGGGARAGMGDIRLSDQMVKDMKGGSAEKHLIQNEDGTYSFSPERQALHDKLIEDALAGVPTSQDPTMTIMGGGPASGKSTLLSSGAGGSIPVGKAASQVNPDNMKEALPEWESMGSDPTKAAFLHEESSYLSKRLVAASLERKTDIVLDGTGDSSPESMIGKVTSARNAGYKVNGVYVTVPTQTALDRALARGKETGRFVSPDVITNTHVGVSRTFPAITNQFDSLKLFDTSGTPKLIASGTRDNFEVLDPTLYQAFLDKGK